MFVRPVARIFQLRLQRQLTLIQMAFAATQPTGDHTPWMAISTSQKKLTPNASWELAPSIWKEETLSTSALPTSDWKMSSVNSLDNTRCGRTPGDREGYRLSCRNEQRAIHCRQRCPPRGD
ncbi:hypothetical protein B0T13DRAFT_470782 [Neurospora crassa]|nr:hypothetical protein B0T13DRAFT_470782 [Neurospora crassa]